MTVPHVSERWVKSTRSSENACVELANTGRVRDSKNPHGPVLAASIASLVHAAKAGFVHVHE